jgi:uncharacterized protein (DUF697 family)
MNIRDFVGIIRELSFSEIRHEAMIPPRILVVAPSMQTGTDWARKLFGDESGPFIDVVDASNPDADPLAYDALISIGPIDPDRGRQWIDLFRRASQELYLVEVDPSQANDGVALQGIRRKICDLARDRSVAFGRYIESMRTAAAAEVVSDTSRVNAQFAALSNIPALIPVVGTVFAAGADFLVLTKNQLMMMYRLAAIYDRDLDDRWRVYSELAPVVGAGMFWRTAARQVAAIMPVVLGAVPKVTIAYAGTYAVGQAARYYFEHGDSLSSEEFKQIYREAVVSLRRLRSRDSGLREHQPAPVIEIPTAGANLN